MKNQNIGFMINETISEAQDVKVISENNNRVRIEAVAQEAEEKNRNGRIYTNADLTKEVGSSRTQELIKTGNMFGEAGHPMVKELSRQSTIDPTNIAHKISKLWMDGNKVKMITEGTQNALGQNFNDLILTGTKPSFSLRALGTVQNTAQGTVVKNLKLITYDWVVYPSHPGAYMTKLVSESAGFSKARPFNPNNVEIKNGNKFICDKTDSGILTPIMNESVINYIKSESSNLKSVFESIDTLYDSVTLEGNHVRLMDKDNNIYMITLESYIQKEIMDYCNRY